MFPNPATRKCEFKAILPRLLGEPMLKMHLPDAVRKVVGQPSWW